MQADGAGTDGDGVIGNDLILGHEGDIGRLREGRKCEVPLSLALPISSC
jgi:hypothetical protein